MTANTNTEEKTAPENTSILLLPKGKKRAGLERWFDDGVRQLHCLPWEMETGLKWAERLARLRANGKTMPARPSK